MTNSTRTVLWYWAAGILAVLLILAFVAPVSAQVHIAIDGDTLRVGNERIRIVGVDTPETFSPQCEDEAKAGYQAAGRLQHLMNARKVRIERTGKKDKYGRTLAKVYVGVDDVAAVMVREGLGRPYSGGKRQPWCETGTPREGAW